MSPSILNSVLARWLEDQPHLVPGVDCGACTLSAERPHERVRWAAYKCCTFQPFVACFSAGAMLAEGLDPITIDGTKALRLPIGIVASKPFRSKREAIPDGRRGEEQLCTYFDQTARRCGIWRFRPGECSLHFCSGQGASERERLSHQVFALESAVAQMALIHLGFSARQVGEQIDLLNDPGSSPAELSRSQADELYRAAWDWARTRERGEILSWLDSRQS